MKFTQFKNLFFLQNFIFNNKLVLTQNFKKKNKN